MINFDILNHAIGNVSSDEFATLYLIANTLSLKKVGRTRLYREMLADKLGWYDEERPQYGLKKITRLTNSLVEKGYLKKDIVYENPTKSVTYYSLNTQILEKKLDTSTQKSVPLNNNKIEVIEEKEYNNEMDGNPLDGFQPSHNEEYRALLQRCLDNNVPLGKCYTIYAMKGQEHFNWLCNFFKKSERLYSDYAQYRQNAAKEFHLSIPT